MKGKSAGEKNRLSAFSPTAPSDSGEGLAVFKVITMPPPLKYDLSAPLLGAEGFSFQAFIVQAVIKPCTYFNTSVNYS